MYFIKQLFSKNFLFFYFYLSIEFVDPKSAPCALDKYINIFKPNSLFILYWNTNSYTTVKNKKQNDKNVT